MYNKVSSEIIKELRDICGNSNVLTGPEDLKNYSHDEVPEIGKLPEVVVKPASAQEISKILILANKNLVPVTPRGGGTGLSGGAVPVNGGIVLSLERMNKIIEVDQNNLMAVVEPGVVVSALKNEVQKTGLLYPVDPASMDSCHIGGNVAECAGGASAVKYGVTKNYVTGLEAVLPTGEILNLGGKLVKNVTGYDLISLIVGSEGTLAVVTKIILRLLPAPKLRITLLVPYDSMEKAIETVSAIIRNRIIPTTIEVMDSATIKICQDYLKRTIPFNDAAAHLLIEIHGSLQEEIDKVTEAVGEICMNMDAKDVIVAATPAEQDKLWEARRSIREAIKEKGVTLDEDIVVPRSEIPAMVKKLAEISKKYSVDHIVCGHAGDGNLHVHIFKGKHPEGILLKELFSAAVSLGGMISGEHGIGITKKDYMGISMQGEAIELMRRIKKAFDPNDILNPGKIF